MITITHYRRELGWDRHALAFVDVPYEPAKAGYYLGYDKPNYPMPAIRYDLEIDEFSVSLYRHDNGRDWSLVKMWIKGLSH